MSYNDGTYSLEGYSATPSVLGPQLLSATGIDDEAGAAAGARWQALSATGGDDDRGSGVLIGVFPPPTTVARRNMRRYACYSYTAPGVDTGDGLMVKQERTELAVGLWGYRQLIIDGHDVTVHRGHLTKFGQMTRAVPGGPNTLRLIFPAARPFEAPGGSALPWLKDGAAIQVRHRFPDDTLDANWAFEGDIHQLIPVMQGDDWHWEADVKGFLHTAENKVHTPPFTFYSDAAQDVGERVAQTLDYPGRRFAKVTAVVTGILTGVRGSLSQSKLQAVLDLLAVAWTGSGEQYTLLADPGPGRKVHLAVPSRTPSYHIAVGADGLDLSGVTPGGGLTSEGDEAPNVVFGEYITPDGYRSQHIKYPHEHEDTAPGYPLMDPAVFDPGDGHTGFQPFSDWLRRHGYAIYSQDSYDARDEDDVKAAQAWMGVSVDGSVGRQTWGTAFNTGANVGDLSGVFYMPLAADTRTQPRLYTPDGQDIGANPAYDPTFPVREIYINFGSGITEREAVNSARQIITRNKTGYNYAGQIRMTCDVEEGSRFDILEGKVLAVRYLAGSGSTGVPFFISQVSEEDPESDDDAIVLDVDTRFRDALTVGQLIENQRTAKNDPARQRRLQETGKLTQTTQPIFDRDNGAGRIGKHAVQGGYWRVVKFPSGSYGTFVELIALSSPNAEFVLGLFVKPVTANYLRDRVGNPLDPTSVRPFDVNRADLQAAGFIQGWGSGIQPGGYSLAFSGAKTLADPLTGRIEDNAATDWASFNPPWLWLVEYSAVNTDLTVTFRNAPELV